MRKRQSYRKPHIYKKKKPVFRKRFFWLGILAVAVFSGLFYCLFFLQAFQIEKIIVTGEDKVSKEEIELIAQERLESRVLFIKTKSIFSVNLNRIKQDILSSFPQIAEIEISRGFFDAINIVVIERHGIALWCQEDNCFLLDSQGIIFEQVEKADLILIETKPYSGELGQNVVEEELLSQIFEIKLKIEKDSDISVERASLISKERLNIKTSEGWQIYFNLKGDIDWQITELKLVLEKQISLLKRADLEYIDLRFSRVYYK